MNVRQLIKDATGLNLSVQAAERALRERMNTLGLDDTAAYLAAITPDEMQALVELVVVPESWMFRDGQAFAAATAYVLQCLAVPQRRQVRILSIPCAGGEEPYSMAMALADAAVPPAAAAIDAIDVSEVSLERARRGRYTRNAFRGPDTADFRSRHFTQVGAEYEIHQDLRERVRFSHGNLLSLDAISSAGRYDVIFCRNLLIYFDDATTATAVAKLRLMLADDGVLFAGYAEVPTFCANGFTPMRMPGAFALQKERRTQPRVGPRAAAPDTSAAAAPAASPPVAWATMKARATAAPPERVTAPPPAASVAAPAVLADLLARARALADQGDYGAASAACQAALVADPSSSDAYFILGIVSDCQGEKTQAGEHWRRCIYLQPDHYDALCHLALLAEQHGDASQAGALRQRAARVFGRARMSR